jgi:hypothetical protein
MQQVSPKEIRHLTTNTVVRRSWTYAERMPTLPLFGTGLAPLMQWITVPVVATVLDVG